MAEWRILYCTKHEGEGAGFYTRKTSVRQHSMLSSPSLSTRVDQKAVVRQGAGPRGTAPALGTCGALNRQQLPLPITGPAWARRAAQAVQGGWSWLACDGKGAPLCIAKNACKQRNTGAGAARGGAGGLFLLRIVSICCCNRMKAFASALSWLRSRGMPRRSLLMTLSITGGTTTIRERR